MLRRPIFVPCSIANSLFATRPSLARYAASGPAAVPVVASSPESDCRVEEPCVGCLRPIRIERVDIATFCPCRFQDAKEFFRRRVSFVYGLGIYNPDQQMSDTGIYRARCQLRQDFAWIKPERLRQRIHIAQRVQQAQGGLPHTTVNPGADFLTFNRQNIGTNLLVERLRGCQRAKISMLAQPEPRSEGVVPGAEDLRTACYKRPQLSIRTRALRDERGLGLIELAGKLPHLLFA
jgi:hypothetical protein